MRGALRLYRPVLDAALAHPLRAAAVALAALGLGAAAYLGTGKAFMPTMDEGDILLQLQKPPSIGLNRSRDIDLAVQKAILAQVPEVEHSIARVGSDELGLDPMGLNETDMFMQLADRRTWRMDKQALGDEIRKVMEAFPGLDFGFTQPIEMRVSEMLTAAAATWPSSSSAPTWAPWASWPCASPPASKRSPRARRADAGQRPCRIPAGEGGRPGRRPRRPGGDRRAGRAARAARRRAGRHGHRGPAAHPHRGARRCAAARIARALQGPAAGPQRRPGAAAAGDIPLASLAAIATTQGPVLVRREGGSRFALIQSMVSGRDLVGFVDEARATVARDVPLPSGYRLEWGGQFENQQRAAARLGLVVPVSLALIFFVLFMTFGSVRQAVLILGNVPFALVGGMAALWVSGQYLSVPASVGFIALLGIAVLNGLVMVTHFNQLHALGMPMDQVVREGSLRRLRPVLMTASITAFGLVPLLLSTGRARRSSARSPSS